MMTKFFLYFLAFFTVVLHAQTPSDATALRQVDSVLAAVKQQVAKKQYAEALVTNAAAEKLALETFGRQSLPYADCCYRHATILQNQWNKTSIEEAVKWAFEALAIRQAILGKDHMECARCLGKLAAFHSMLQQYDQAQAYGLEARRILEETNNTDDPDYPIILNSLAASYSNMGNYAKGEAVYMVSKQYMEKKGGKESKAYVQVLSQLANQNIWTGNYAKALQYAREAADIYKKMGGENDVYYAFCLRNLVQANMGLKQYGEAEKQILQALDIVEKTVGKNDFRYADILNLCGTLYNNMQAYDKALPILIESLQLIEKSSGKDNARYSGALSNLATAYIETGQLKKAEPLLVEAVAIQENMDGRHATLTVFNRLGSLYRMTGRFDLAESLYRKIEDITQPSSSNKINYMSEAELQQLISGSAYLEANAFSLAYTAVLHKALPPDITGICYDNALFYKGFLQQSAIRVRQLAATHPGSRADLDSLKSLQTQLGKMYASPKEQRDLTGIATLEDNANEVQKKLARSIVGYAEATLQVHWPDVQKNLRRDEAAVEFVRFDYYNRSVQFPTDSTLYAALVLRPGDDQPRFIPLFEEREIATLFKNKGGRKSDYVNRLYANPASKTGPQKNLYQAIWQPLETALAGAKTVYFSPSGLLHRINFNAIPGQDGKPLADHFHLVQLGSTRQIALPPTVANAAPSMEARLFGGIYYEIDSLAETTKAPRLQDHAGTRGDPTWADADSTLRGGTWAYLPWTEKEVISLQPMLQQAGLQPILSQGAEASEALFKSMGTMGPSPRVLHVATHGFFFPDPQNLPQQAGTDESTFKRAEHPMIRSGLILAGGNYAWKTGKPFRPDREDGIITAYEISQMNLSNTELVVLSACETGLGDIEGQEGVYGLQRAFKIAGASYLIMSLWQVPDAATQELMTAFYRYWLTEKLTIPAAFRAAQKDMQQQYEHPFFWAGFILLN